MRFFKVTAKMRRGNDKKIYKSNPVYCRGLDELTHKLDRYSERDNFVMCEIVSISEAEYVKHTHPDY